MPPVIAITAPLRTENGAVRVRLGLSYPRAVEHAGALPVLVAPLLRNEDAGRIMDAADGLLLTGGEDVDPARYGAVRHPTVTSVSTERDATELALLDAAQQRGKPVLAICRGIQLLNVAFGGTLVQDIASERPGALMHDQEDRHAARVHPVRVEPGTRLASALGVADLQVNSFHHQAPDRVGQGLRLTAKSPDGIVEGIEWTGAQWWAVGVQWHPEELDGHWEAGLFKAFVGEASHSRRS
jgi:putative glutamine amidotransferase